MMLAENELPLFESTAATTVVHTTTETSHNTEISTTQQKQVATPTKLA